MCKWAKITFDEFIQHFAALDDKQIVKDVHKSIEDLAEGNSRGKSFGAFIVKSSIERISKVSKQNKVNGSKGGFATAAKYRKIKELTAQNNDQVTSPISANNQALTAPSAGGSCDTFTADVDIREDSKAKPDGSAITRNETRAHDALDSSANLDRDAVVSEAQAIINQVSNAITA